jgi:hypothetical protein
MWTSDIALRAAILDEDRPLRKTLMRDRSADIPRAGSVAKQEGRQGRPTSVEYRG